MKFITVVVVLNITGAAWSKDYYEMIEKKAPWLAIPRPKEVDKEQYPWQVAVIADDSLFCGGSLVTKKWVITTAHCTLDYQVFDLAVGSNQDVRQTTRSVVRHPDYIPHVQEKNVALLELPEELTLSRTVDIVRLPTAEFSETNTEGMNLIIAGWATLEDRLSIWAGVNSPPLKSIQVRGAPDSACRATYGESFYPISKICLETTSSSHDEGVLSLVDGGLPVVFQDRDGKYTQIGILSFGPGQSTLRPPVVATKVVSVLPWIKKITGLPSK